MDRRSEEEYKQILNALSEDAAKKLDRVSKALCENNTADLKLSIPEAVQTIAKSRSTLASISSFLESPRSTSMPSNRLTCKVKNQRIIDRESRALNLYFTRLAIRLVQHKQYDYASIIAQTLVEKSRVAAQIACLCEHKAGRHHKCKLIAYLNREDRLTLPFSGKESSFINKRIDANADPTILLSIIITVLEDEPFLYHTLSSIEKQTHHQLEIIIIDDGSTGNSPSIINKFLKQSDLKVKVIKNKVSVGLGASRNQGVDAATGVFLGFVNPNDWIHKDYYKSFFESASNMSDIIFAGGYHLIAGNNTKQILHNVAHFIDPKSPLYKFHPGMKAWDKIFRRDFLVQNNIRFQASSSCINAQFLIEAYHLAKQVEIKPGLRGYYYWSDVGASSANHEITLEKLDSAIKGVQILESNSIRFKESKTFNDCLCMHKWLILHDIYASSAITARPIVADRLYQEAMTSDIGHIVNLLMVYGTTEVATWIRGLDPSKSTQAKNKENLIASAASNSPSHVNELDKESCKSLIEFSKQLSLAKKTKHIHTNWYSKNYPEIAELGLDPATHYLRLGAAKGYNPGKSFDTIYYLKTHAEAAESGLNPLVHYALFGQDKGYETRPKNEVSQIEFHDVRAKLLSLGFSKRPLNELDIIASCKPDSGARAMAGRELALWHMRAKTKEGYRKSLKWLDHARNNSQDNNFLSELCTIELLCHYFLDNYSMGIAAYERTVKNIIAKPDLLLARMNFETTPDGRIPWMNKVLDQYGIEPITLMQDTGQSPYDRLTCAQPLPKVTDGPKVSVLIACYNAADTLPTALRSLQEQTWHNLEIIVLDDCSPTMDTVHLAERFAESDPRIKVVRMKKNGGAYVARNQGLEMATGEFITIHDADDWSHPRKIETQVHFMKYHPDVMGCTSEQARVKEDLTCSMLRSNYGFIIFNTSSFLWRRTTVHEALGYWDSVRFGADSEFIRRVQEKFGAQAVHKVNTGPLSFQREAMQSITSDPIKGLDLAMYGIRKEYQEMQIYFHQIGGNLYYRKDPSERPFPVPEAMITSGLEDEPSIREVNIVIKSDLRQNSKYVTAALSIISECRLRQKTVGIVQDIDYDQDIKNHYLDLRMREGLLNGDMIIFTYGETVKCDEILRLNDCVEDDDQRFLPTILCDPQSIRSVKTNPSNYHFSQ
jgi:glycosyltransferase involved in cell wall biosynthesis